MAGRLGAALASSSSGRDSKGLCAVLHAQALDAAKTAVQRLEKGGKRWQRPPDYYAEMVKSDEHMARVKSQLMREQTQIAEAQERCVRAEHS